MDPALTPRQMGAADQRAIAAGTPGAVLMGRAGRAVARAVRTELGGTYGRRVTIVCGPGNNGGDGHVAAGALASWGARVDVFTLGDTFDRDRCARSLARADALVDALFGTGLRAPLDGDAAWFARETATFDGARVAVDVPSGVAGLTGRVLGADSAGDAIDAAGVAVRADRTVCFAAYKPGLLFTPGSTHAGTVDVVDIGIDVTLPAGEPSTGVTTGDDVAAWLPVRAPDAQKWSAGGLLVIGGSQGMTGAPLMVSHAAMRTGAGIVWCALPGAQTAASASGGEVITTGVPATPSGSLATEAVAPLLELATRFAAVVIGPGLGRDPDTATAVRQLVAELSVPIVLDADGLNALAGDVAPLRTRAGTGAATILTPHGGEYARLARHPVGDDRLAAARGLAAHSESVVLLKGPGAVIAEPTGRAVIDPTGGPWLATAGSGDVLSGMIGALVAARLDPFEAGAAGAWLHGRAADVAGHTGLVAGDLITALPEVLAGFTAPAGRGADAADPYHSPAQEA
ncbi:MAG TPA: NAD(P)H-hydrate dehydratase [Acidimicrobiia bacterium]|nr:NAD(P)H-hydrate dehydratase [Acidimicrobiia bacterium]